MSKAFAVFLQEYQGGRTHAEMTSALAELLQKVRDTGKAGSITLEITVSPASRGSSVDKVLIKDKIKSKLPALERSTDLYWLTDDSELSRNHPRQSALDLRDASTLTATPPLKEAIQ